MRVWLIHPGEPLPIDGPVRLLRYGVLSEMLAARGHHATQWASTFSHPQKRFRSSREQEIRLNERQSVQLMDAGGYQKNRSIARLLYHRRLPAAFHRCASAGVRPDVILVSMPSAGVCRAVLDYAGPRSVPVVIDVRDLWPDVFLDMIPRVAVSLGRLALLPAIRANREVFRRATAITAISEEYLEWGLGHAGRKRGPADQVFPMGYPALVVAEKERAAAERDWSEWGVRRDRPLCCFLGSITGHFDFGPVVASARQLPDVQFVICGDGDGLGQLRALTKGLDNVFLPGWVGVPHMVALMEWADVGLAPYATHARMSLPNKIFEYFFGGLPVVSSLRGELEELLEETGSGISYGHDLKGLPESLRALLTDRARLLKMGDRARQVYEDRFSANRIYEKLITYLEEIAAPPVGRELPEA